MVRRKVTGNKRLIVLGMLVVLSASSVAANLATIWMAASLLVGSGMAAYALLRQPGKRHARTATKSRAGQSCAIHPAEEQVFLFAQNDSLQRAREELSAGLQDIWQETGFRRALSDRIYSRRVLVRRPAPGRKRQHLREWGHR
jgi:hypothetical protein